MDPCLRVGEPCRGNAFGHGYTLIHTDGVGVNPRGETRLKGPVVWRAGDREDGVLTCPRGMETAGPLAVADPSDRE